MKPQASYRLGFLWIFLFGALLAWPQSSSVSVTGRVLGRVMLAEAGMAAPAGLRQEAFLLELRPNDPTAAPSVALVYYRFHKPAERLSASVFRSQGLQSFNLLPLAPCPATLRQLLQPSPPGSPSGAAARRLPVAMAPGVSASRVIAYLETAPTCYLLPPASMETTP